MLAGRNSGSLSHSHRRPRTLSGCRAHSRHQQPFCCPCCLPSRSPRRQTNGITIGTATASSPAIISRLTTACRFMAPRAQSATTLKAMCRATTVAGITTSAVPGFSAADIMAAQSARAGHGRPSGQSGIADKRQQTSAAPTAVVSGLDHPLLALAWRAALFSSRVSLPWRHSSPAANRRRRS
jgi:hypothetical protein